VLLLVSDAGSGGLGMTAAGLVAAAAAMVLVTRLARGA
jgi:biopolymer transport protein ExbB/TolQ